MTKTTTSVPANGESPATEQDQSNSQPKEISMNTQTTTTSKTLSFSGTTVEITEKNNVLHFGSYTSKRRARLEGFGEIYGFLNALAGVLTDGYPILVPGAHFKYDMAVLEGMFDMPKKDMNIGYVKFSLLKDETIREWLAASGIVERPDSRKRWLAIRIKHGEMFVKFANIPMAKDTLTASLEERGVEETPFVLENWKAAWDIEHKQNGLERVIDLFNGDMQISCLPVNPRPGFEYEQRKLQVRFEQLFGESDTLKKAILDGVRGGRESTYQAVRAGILRSNPKLQQETAMQLAEQGLTVILDGEPRETTTVDMIGRLVTILVGAASNGQFFLKDDAAVVAVFQRANRLQGKVEVLG